MVILSRLMRSLRSIFRVRSLNSHAVSWSFFREVRRAHRVTCAHAYLFPLVPAAPAARPDRHLHDSLLRLIREVIAHRDVIVPALLSRHIRALPARDRFPVHGE